MKIVPVILALLTTLSAGLAQSYLSPSDVVLSKDRKTIHIVAGTSNQLLDFDLTTRTVVRTTALPGEPTNATLSKNGKTLYVTGGGPNGRVWVVEDGRVVREIEAGHTPMAPILSPDGATLYVCNRFDTEVSFIDLASGKTTARVAVLREPTAADLTHDGRFLFVGNHIPDGRADVDYVASKISVIDTATREVKTIPLVNGAEGVRGVRISPDGKTVFATHLMARFLVPTTQLERGWVSTDALSVIDVASQELKYTVLLDDVDRGFPNPWAIGFSKDGQTLVVSSAGNHEISLIDLPAMTAKVAAEAQATAGAAHLNAHNNLSFLSGMRKRIPLEGKGPRSLAVDGEFIYIGNYYSDTLEVVRVAEDWSTRSGVFPLGPPQELTAERQGEIFFNDSALCFQNWLSCATCHPDARTDAINWDLLNDGMGNPKNVKTMLLSHQTPRAMWLGVRADAKTAVRAGIRHIQFAVRPEADAEAIDAYLKSLQPVPSPYLVDGELSAKAQLGQAVFERLGCNHCHPAPYYTDLQMYDMGTTKGQDEGLPVDTPHLIEAWRTA
ncbi:cell surface protein, partial [Pontiella sp.]|uniref:cell surface protein n=1 Tax=Pontiella sp. TaxID=2837462 RepID=UPI0035656132